MKPFIIHPVLALHPTMPVRTVRALCRKLSPTVATGDRDKLAPRFLAAGAADEGDFHSSPRSFSMPRLF
jgi:hypothetical protein